PPLRLTGDLLSATAQELAPFVAMAGEAIQREYPVMLMLHLMSAADLGLPREITPAFHGSFDWHSAVHGHWCLARAVRLHPAAEWAPAARGALSRTLTREHLAAELRFLERRPGFVRPALPGRRRGTGRLRAFWPGLPLTGARGGGPHAPRPAARGVRELALQLPARHARRDVHALARAGAGGGPERREVRAPRRSQSARSEERR